MKIIRNKAGTKLVIKAAAAIIARLARQENICFIPKIHETLIIAITFDSYLDNSGKTKTVTMATIANTGSCTTSINPPIEL